MHTHRASVGVTGTHCHAWVVEIETQILSSLTNTFFYIVCVCVYVYVHTVCIDQRITFQSWFSPSTEWVLRIKLGLSAWW